MTLTHFTDDHFEIKLIVRLLDQIYVVQMPQSPLRYDDTPWDPTSFTHTVNNTGSLTASALMLPLHMLVNPTLETNMYMILHLYVLLSINDRIIF